VATSNLSKEMQRFLEKLRNNPLDAFNEGLSEMEKVMKGLSDQREEIKLEGKLAKVRGEFDKVEQMESRLRAVGEALKEAAAAKEEDAQQVQELFKEYQELARQLRVFKGEAEDVEGGVVPEVSVYDPEGSDLPPSTLNLDVELNLDQAKLALDRFKTMLGNAVSSASRRFGQEFSSAIWSAFSGPDERRMASLEERRLDLKQELRNLNRKEMAHERYAARVKAIHAELAETNKQLARETAGVFERVFEGITNTVKNVIQQVIAEISAAIAKAAILTGISALTSGGVPFMSFLTGRKGVGALFGSATATQATASSPIPSSPARAGALTVNLRGEFRQRGQDLVATINTTQNANTRRGRSR
jgi:DNA repair exonuclease SbcCD ATPase subunit